MLVQRELRARYAGSNLGMLWNLLNPLVFVGIYIVVFSQIMTARMGTDVSRYDYAIHLCTGMIPWFFFSEVLGRTMSVLLENSNMLRKMAIPVEVLYLSVYCTSVLIHGTTLLALMLILLIAGVPLAGTVVLALPVMLVMGLVALGFGMMFSVMALLVRDVPQIVQIALQIGFWTVPIVYVPKALPEHAQWLLTVNPLGNYIGLIQRLFGVADTTFTPNGYYVIALLPFLAIMVGRSFYAANRAEILDAL